MQLLYEGKKSIGEIEAIVRHISSTADPIPETPTGLLIQGDNLSAMCRMLPNYSGKLDLVYIDPPYNTQRDFYFSPERTSHISASSTDQLAYSDKFTLHEYLEFLRERLYAIHKLLSEKGTLYIHLDCAAGPHIKIILDEIFGPENFLNDIARIKSNPKNFHRNAYGNQKDVIYVYAKCRNLNIFNSIKLPPAEGDLLRLFPKADETGQPYTTVPCHAPGETKNGPTGQPWRGISPPPGRHWRCAPAELDKLDSQGLIEWSKNGNPRIKKFAADHSGKKLQDVWENFKDPPHPIYPTEKNMEMLELIAKQSSNPGSLVMDAFCGSGSFLAAALRHRRIPIGIDSSDAAIAIARQRPELEKIPLFTDISPPEEQQPLTP